MQICEGIHVSSRIASVIEYKAESRPDALRCAEQEMDALHNAQQVPYLSLAEGGT